MKMIINQKDHYAGNCGLALRSSAVFYYLASPLVRTTISVSNYWKFKNNLDVTIVASTRGMDGTLARREVLEFNDGLVLNYRPQENFEGSVEIEALSLKNLRIPYAAIMAIYESPRSVSMVHSYARNWVRSPWCADLSGICPAFRDRIRGSA